MADKKIEKIEYNGEKYYYCNGEFVDSSFLTLSTEDNIAVGEYYFGQVKYEGMGRKDLKDFIYLVKNAKVFRIAEKVCEYAITKYEEDYLFVRSILPTYTSLLRSNGKSQRVIDVYKKYRYMYDSHNAALLTSVAAAYCDLNDRENAIKYAKFAYWAQGGSPEKGYKFNELTLVFRRICTVFGLKTEDVINA